MGDRSLLSCCPASFALLCLFGFMLTGAIYFIYFLRQDTHPNESFLQLMLLSFMRLPLARRMRRDAAIIPTIREQ